MSDRRVIHITYCLAGAEKDLEGTYLNRGHEQLMAECRAYIKLYNTAKKTDLVFAGLQVDRARMNRQPDTEYWFCTGIRSRIGSGAVPVAKVVSDPAVPVARVVT